MASHAGTAAAPTPQAPVGDRSAPSACAERQGRRGAGRGHRRCCSPARRSGRGAARAPRRPPQPSPQGARAPPRGARRRSGARPARGSASPPSAVSSAVPVTAVRSPFRRRCAAGEPGSGSATDAQQASGRRQAAVPVGALRTIRNTTPLPAVPSSWRVSSSASSKNVCTARSASLAGQASPTAAGVAASSGPTRRSCSSSSSRQAALPPRRSARRGPRRGGSARRGTRRSRRAPVRGREEHG